MARKTDESCPTCGTKLHALHLDALQTCSECGRLGPNGFEYCGHCGAPILAVPQPVQKMDSIEALIEEALGWPDKPLEHQSPPAAVVDTAPSKPAPAVTTGPQPRPRNPSRKITGFKKPAPPRAAKDRAKPQARVASPKAVRAAHTVAVPALQPARPWDTPSKQRPATIRVEHVPRPPADPTPAPVQTPKQAVAAREIEGSAPKKRPRGTTAEGSRKHKALSAEHTKPRQRSASTRPAGRAFGAGVLSRYGR